MESGTTRETPSPERFGSTIFWRVFAVINLVTVLWVLWVIWQLIPRPVVNEFVLRMPRTASHGQLQREASGAIKRVPSLQGAGPAPVAPPSGEISIQNDPPMKPLRLETEIKTPPK